MRAATMMVTLALFPVVAAAQEEVPPIKAQLTGFTQIQFSSSSVGDDELTRPGRTVVPVATTMFEARRVRFGADITASGWIVSKVEAELAPGRVKIADVWAELVIDPRFIIRTGQYKKPFSLVELYSDTKQVVIERGVRIRGLSEAAQAAEARGAAPIVSLLAGEALLGEMFALLSAGGYAGRDFGVSLRGKLGALEYEGGVFNGAGQDRPDDNDGKSMAARVRLRPSKALFFVAAAVSSRETLVSPANETPRTERGTAFEVDFELGDFRRVGWNGQLELATGDNLALDDRFVGGQGVLTRYGAVGGKRLEGWEAGARVSYGDPGADRADDEGWLFSPLLNLYFAGRNRMMFGWDVYVPATDALSSANAFRAELQLYY
jgi:hypothetical protein